MRDSEMADAFARVCLELRRFSARYRISDVGDEAIYNGFEKLCGKLGRVTP